MGTKEKLCPVEFILSAAPVATGSGLNFPGDELSAEHTLDFERACRKGQTMERDTESRQVGLARALSKLGFCSRSQAAKLIRAGRVRLNGATRKNPETPVHLQRDRIEVDGSAVAAEAKIYVMLNKPRGVVTTASDEKGRQTVYSLLDEKFKWVGPVGRLDKASEGLLLLTNDSEWAARISDPGSHLVKTYHVHVEGSVSSTVTNILVNGVRSGGELLRAKQAHVLRSGEKNTWLEIVLEEGKNRQIRRMLEHLGIEVLRLIRVAIGPLVLGQLAKGKFRALEAAEKAALDHAVKISRAKPRIPGNG
jgi:23S rRNA pseudouridine2605 synthase